MVFDDFGLHLNFRSFLKILDDLLRIFEKRGQKHVVYDSCVDKMKMINLGEMLTFQHKLPQFLSLLL